MSISSNSSLILQVTSYMQHAILSAKIKIRKVRKCTSTCFLEIETLPEISFYFDSICFESWVGSGIRIGIFQEIYETMQITIIIIEG